MKNVNDAFEFSYEGHTLVCLPSVHFRVVFADRVNQLCHDPLTRPDAIAVELGPQTASESTIWLKELCSYNSLPVMMALLKDNNRISSAFKNLAFQMQKSEAKDLSEFPPEELKNYFNYSSKTIFPLSPADSICEALRCGIELGVPIYGVDLEDIADRQQKHNLRFEDPSNNYGSKLDEYLLHNLSMASTGRELGIDYPREFAMAARLKHILLSHKRVLFVCGMAHWGGIRELISDKKISALPIKFQSNSDRFTRCILNPVIAALNFMDLFPAYVAAYNQNRNPVKSGHYKTCTIDPGILLEEIMDKVKSNYFSFNTSRNENQTADIYSFTAFKDFLSNFCLLKLKSLPDLKLMIDACEAVMSPEFTKTLSNEFMKFNWATNRQFDLPIITPVPLQYDEQYLKTHLIFPNNEKSDPFYLSSPFSREGIGPQNIPWDGREEMAKDNGNGEEDRGNENEKKSPLRTWPPIDYLISALSLEARMLAKKKNIQPIEFHGSLMDGIDIKSTLRATARAENKIYVKEIFDSGNYDSNNEYNLDPVVWILDTSEDNKSDWQLYGEDNKYIKDYISDLDLMKKRLSQGQYLAALTYGTVNKSAQKLEKYKINMEVINKGLVYFIPPFFSPQQDAIFIEKFDYRRIPIIMDSDFSIASRSSINILFDQFNKKFNINLNSTHWPVSMVRIALKYALHEVTVIVPNNYMLDKVIFTDARISGKQINIAPLNFFTKDYIDKISKNYGVKTLPGTNGKKFPESAEIYLNEKQDTYKNLIPKWFLDWQG